MITTPPQRTCLPVAQGALQREAHRVDGLARAPQYRTQRLQKGRHCSLSIGPCCAHDSAVALGQQAVLLKTEAQHGPTGRATGQPGRVSCASPEVNGVSLAPLDQYDRFRWQGAGGTVFACGFPEDAPPRQHAFQLGRPARENLVDLPHPDSRADMLGSLRPNGAGICAGAQAESNSGLTTIIELPTGNRVPC